MGSSIAGRIKIAEAIFMSAHGFVHLILTLAGLAMQMVQMKCPTQPWLSWESDVSIDSIIGAEPVHIFKQAIM